MEAEFGLIFDFDGTLFDDIPVTERILRRLWDFYQINITEKQFSAIINTILERMSHTGSKIDVIKLILYVAKEFGIPWWNRIAFLKKSDKYYKEEIAKCELFPKTIENLSFIKESMYLGLFTTTPYLEIQYRLKKYPQFLEFFENAVSTGDRVKFSKPHPEGITRILDIWKIEPNRVVMFGDMAVDIEAAQKPGCKSIGVLTGYGKERDFKKAKADLIIPSIENLVEYLPQIKELLKN